MNGVAQAAGDDGKVLLFFTVYLAENGDGQELEGIEGCRGIAGQAEDYRTVTPSLWMTPPYDAEPGRMVMRL